jgi:prolyl-tRNA synthetase
MRQTDLLIPTLREVPAEAEMISHRLMLRAGLIRMLVSGVYTFLPLGLRVLHKVERIVREEMDRAGAQEVLLPALQPGELWQKSGRWDTYGPELVRLEDRHGRQMVLGPTHEEVITALLAAEVNSYRKLPQILYQIQTKFRDERRPRSGLLRAREFIMKDAYSFDVDEAGLARSYQAMYEAYNRIFARMGLDFRAVEADAGAIGGTGTHEFIVLSDAGEDTIVSCTRCEYAANIEKAEVAAAAGRRQQVEEARKQAAALEKVHTPGMKTMEEVSQYLALSPSQMIKTLLYQADDRVVAALVRGDHELNEIKLKAHLGVDKLELANQETVQQLTSADVGFAGPVGLSVDIYADYAVAEMTEAVIGANQTDYHYLHAVPERDFQVKAYLDLRVIQEGDDCPRCGGAIHFSRGIEVGHIFQLGTRYSEKLGAYYLDENGQRKPMIMGCYGIGVSRLIPAVIEQSHDEYGIIWPQSIAPFQVHLIPVNLQDEAQRRLTEELYQWLRDQAIEVLLDDRPERVGVKLNDADLIGIPWRILVGKKAVEGRVELKNRKTGEVQEWELTSLKEQLITLLEQ